MRKQRAIREKLSISLEAYAEQAGIPEERASYSSCISRLSIESDVDILSTIPTFDKVLTPDEIKVFAANERVGRALSYIERWQLSRKFGKGDELLDAPYCFAVRQKDNLTNFAVASSSCKRAKIKVVELWTEFSYQYGFEFPEVVLAVDNGVVFVLVFKPASFMTLLDWSDVWDLPEITANFRVKLEAYTQRFRLKYAETTKFRGSIPNYDSSVCSLDEYIGDEQDRITEDGFDLCTKGMITRKDWRRLKRLFNLGRVLYIAHSNWERSVVENPLPNVVFSRPFFEGMTFVYVKGSWDIEIPISRGVILRMIPDFKIVKRLKTEA